MKTVEKRRREKGEKDPRAVLVPRTVFVQPVIRNVGAAPATDIHVVVEVPAGFSVESENSMESYWKRFPRVGLEHIADAFRADQRTAEQRLWDIPGEVFGFGLFKLYTGHDSTRVSDAPGGPVKASFEPGEVVYHVAKLKPAMARVGEPFYLRASRAIDRLTLSCRIIGDDLNKTQDLRIRRRSAR